MDIVGQGPAVGTAAPSARLDVIFRQWNTLLEALPVGVVVCDADGVVTHYNRRAGELLGRAPQSGAAHAQFIDGLRVAEPGGRALEAHEFPIRETLSSASPVRDRELVIERPDGARMVVLANVEPLLDEAGMLIGAVSCFQDVSEVKRARARVSLFDNWIRDVVGRSPVAMCVTDAEGRIMTFNPAAERLWGRTPVAGEDRWCGPHRLFHPDGRPMRPDSSPLAQALKTGAATVGQEVLFERPDGARGAFLSYPTLLHDAEGRVAGAVEMQVDISDRKQAEERQKVLVDELNHRVKNTLASVQSLAAHSLRGGDDPRRMRERFEARLLALSNAHNQLAHRRWEDADFRVLAEEVLAPYRADHRVLLDGEAVMLSARAAVTLSMVLHELATNAVKYGALSTPAGRLALSWRRMGPSRFQLEWIEAGGPPVAKPEQQGFGVRFIAGAIGGELGGRVEHVFAPEGVHCRIETPL